MTKLEEYKALQLYNDICLLQQARMTSQNRSRINILKRELEQILEGEGHDSFKNDESANIMARQQD